jgi:hypothetical protein
MQILSAVAMLVFVLVCSAVGLRILWKARATRGAELLCGLGFTLIGLLGYPLSAVSGNGLRPVGEVSLPLTLLGVLFTNGGLACFFEFTRRVFRPSERWARALSLLSIALLGVLFVSYGAVLAGAPADASSFEVTYGLSIVMNLLCMLCFGWIGVEGLVQWRMSLRRLGLGLGDPVVSNRFLLWGAFGSSTTLMVLVLFAVTLSGQASAHSLVGQLAMALFGVTSSLAATLAFFPTRAYLARVGAAAR